MKILILWRLIGLLFIAFPVSIVLDICTFAGALVGESSFTVSVWDGIEDEYRDLTY